MKGYGIKQVNNKFVIVEKTTNLEVHSSENEIQCRLLCLDLNLGYGFDGFTPNFFCNKFKISVDISV